MISTLLTYLKLFAGDRRGVTAMEYGLIAAFVAVAIIGGLQSLAGGLDALLEKIAGDLNAAAAP